MHRPLSPKFRGSLHIINLTLKKFWNLSTRSVSVRLYQHTCLAQLRYSVVLENFNSFFYRKLKPDARPVENPDDPRTLVSGADCRMTAFQTVTEATRIWIKGRTFSIKRLLGEQYKDDASRFEGGSLCIFRLAPQVSLATTSGVHYI